MDRRLISFFSFFLILGLYYLYGWVAVPIVLPEKKEKDQRIQDLETGDSREDVMPFLTLFPEKSWEQNPNVEMIRDSKTVVLFMDDEIVGKKAILKPCTILFLSDDPALSLEEKVRQAVVLRTPDYAEVEFDGELNFSKFPLPKLIGGKMFGKVVIQSDMETPALEDDLYLETQDVAFVETPATTTISTINNVRFRLGDNSGEGAMLRLEMALSDPKNPKSSKTLNRVQFETLKYLNLCFPEENEKNSGGGLLAASPGPHAATNAPKTANLATNDEENRLAAIPLTARAPQFGDGSNAATFRTGPATTIDVRCQREFCFRADEKNIGGWISSFHGNVNVVRTNPDGMKDHIVGDELQIGFMPKATVPDRSGPKNPKQNAQQKATAKDENPLGNLEPVLFRVLGRLAHGNQPAIPARLNSSQNGGVVMVGDQIFYDIRNNFLALETLNQVGASPEVRMILQNRYEIRATKGFQYIMKEDGNFGLLTSEGKGNLKGNLGDEKTPKKIEMSWNKMQIEPYNLDPTQLQIQLEGDVRINMDGFGEMSTDKLDVYCRREGINGQNPNSSADAQTAVATNAEKKSLMIPGAQTFGKGETLQPERAVAVGNVFFKNGNGSCNVHQMLVFFKQMTDAGGTTQQSRWTPYIMTQEPPRLPSSQQNPVRFAFDPLVKELQNRYPIAQARYQVAAGDFVANSTVPPSMPMPMPASTLPKLASMSDSTRTLVAAANPTVPGASGHPTLPQSSGPVSVPLSPLNNPNGGQTAPHSTGNPTSMSSQNLLGFHSADSRSTFNITAERMMLTVFQQEKQSFVQHVWLGGNVRVQENIADVLNGDLIEICGNEVHIWNPSRPDTVIRINGKLPGEEAIFKGKGVQMNAMNVEIFRAENLIWVKSPGRLLTTTGRRNPSPGVQPSGSLTTAISSSPDMMLPLNPLGQSSKNKAFTAQDNRLIVEWNSEMRFNGETIRFFGKADHNGGRVRAYHQDQKMICDDMEIHLNRLVEFFDDKSDVPIEAETIDCAIKVSVENRQFDEHRELKSYDEGMFDAIRIYIKSNDFVAQGPGYLRTTSKGRGNGFSDSGGNKILGGKATQLAKDGELTFLCVWFQDYVRGNFYGNQKRAEITGRVQTVYCPVRGWDDKIELDRIQAAIRRGYYLSCDRMDIVEMPDPVDSRKSSVELTASSMGGTSTIEGEGNAFFGKAQNIKYNQGKSLIIFDGNAYIKANQGEIKAKRIEYDIETGATNTSYAEGLNLMPK